MQSNIGEKLENWDDYRFLLAVARRGSFSAAARALNVSQPTVARHIERLESKLDIQLFNLHSSGAALTELGEEVVSRAKAMEITVTNLNQSHWARESELRGEITVTSTQTLCAFWLSEKIELFSKKFQEISVNCIVNDEKLNIDNREADIALRFGRPTDSEVIGTRVAVVETGIYGSPEYFSQHPVPQELRELSNHKAVGALDPIAKFPQIKELAGITDNTIGISKTNCIHTYTSLANAGVGLICVPCYTVEENTKLQRVLQDKYSKNLEIWLLVHPAAKPAARIQAFLSFIKQEMKTDRHRFMPAA